MSYQPPPPPPDYGYQQQPPAYGYQQQAPQAAYANWGYRVGSYLLDSLISAVPAIIGLIVGGVITAAGTAASQNGGGGAGALGAVGGLIVIVGYLGALGVGIWNIIIRQGSTGQSIGKQVLGTRLVSLQTGQPIGPGMTFVRYLCHFLDALPCYIGYLWPLWDARRQTFADKIIGTVVVRA